MGEGIAGVCGEGWEGRALPRCWEMWASNKGPAWAGRLAPLEGGVTRQKVTQWPDGAPRSTEGPEQREEGSAEPFVCAVLPHLQPIFPDQSRERSNLCIPPKHSVRKEVPGLGTHSTGGQSSCPT